VLFRCDAGTEMGTGHVMRCLTLARALGDRGHECEFACRDWPGHLAALLREAGFRVHLLPAGSLQSEDAEGPPYRAWLGAPWQADAEGTAACIGEGGVDWLVVDHYGIDWRWHQRLRASCRQLMVIDDLADRRHDCDLLLDQNYGRKDADYAQLVPAHCRRFLGCRYLLLRGEFVAQRARSLARRDERRLERVLVMMGGVDRDDASGQALDALAASGMAASARTCVVLGPQAPWIEALREKAASMPSETEILVGIDDVGALMARCDLSIGSGGTGVYERIYMGLPSLVRVIAANQAQALQAMEDAGLIRLYRDAEELEGLLRECLARGGMSQPPAVIGDGRALLCDAMAGVQVELRRPRPNDLRHTFRWLRDPRLREDFLMRGDAPGRRGHFAFWRKLLADPGQHVFSILADGRHVGNAGIRCIDRAQARAELWIYLGESTDRGSGIGARALRQLEDFMSRELGAGKSVLHVGVANAQARAFYAHAGYAEAAPDADTAKFAQGSVVRMEKAL
jgi:UDP-2,4-diacetamido-2,4,6-trideoxy-beta-L-altropyranose hydrolase